MCNIDSGPEGTKKNPLWARIPKTICFPDKMTHTKKVYLTLAFSGNVDMIPIEADAVLRPQGQQI